jgi:mono/diheme cytochrome c family protein
MDRQVRLHHDPRAGTDRIPRNHRAALHGVVAVALALGCLSGCGSGSSGNGTTASPGERVYREQGCGSCHTLAAAGSKGTAGPSLDAKKPDAATVRRFVTQGGKGMVTYNLSPADLDALVRYVVTQSRAK